MGKRYHRGRRKRSNPVPPATFNWVVGESKPLSDSNYIPDEIGQKRFSIEGVMDRFKSWVRRLMHREKEGPNDIEGKSGRREIDSGFKERQR